MDHFLFDLAKRYPQIIMPIGNGVSKSEEYKDVCLRLKESDRVPDFSFDENDKLETFNTIAGVIEIITMTKRSDFEHLVRALAYRCEDKDIPDSTGAIAIFGLNNIEKFKAGNEEYKDSVLILSSGYYSNVDEKMIKDTCGIELSKEEWIEKSVIVRKYHELTHFIMRKVYPDDIDSIRDELIADMVGIFAAFGKFDMMLERLFLGIENDTYRQGGRLENYEGIKDIDVVVKMIEKLNELIKSFDRVEDIWSNIKVFM